jgi:hypothetical protein
MDSQIERIKAELSIAAAWRFLGLRGHPARECRSPFREDKCASFSVYQEKGWERWWDHGSAQGGDVVDLWARAKGISVKEAVADILDLSPTSSSHAKAPNRPPERVLPLKEEKIADKAIQWPENLAPPSEEECRQLAALRSLSPEAFFLAGRLGTLLIGAQRGQRLWISTDCRMRSAARRRLDGLPLDGIGKKSASPKNSPRDWIIGTQTTNPALDQLRSILVVEGEGDYYAGLQLAIESEFNFKVLAVLGAATRTFHPEAQPQFRGATVLVIAHNDRNLAGEKAAKDWAARFLAFGARDCFIQKLPIVCDDLNDFLIQRPHDGPKLLKDFHDGTSPGRKR